MYSDCKSSRRPASSLGRNRGTPFLMRTGVSLYQPTCKRCLSNEALCSCECWIRQEPTWPNLQDLIREAFQERIQRGAGEHSEGRET